ncbi:MAG: MBL fold metallo-hydrolase [Spirochaetales bacterium]|nr:MBL fold metallo-hydrolase [Spirochaetales bacterium]
MNVYLLGYTGSMQRRGVSNTSLAIVAEGRTLLVDLSGSPVQALKEAEIDPATIVGVLLTHTHVDHIYALPSLLHQLWLGGRTEPLALIANGPTVAFAKRLIDLFDLERKKGFFPLIRHEIEEGDLEIGPLSLRLFPVIHGVPTSGLSVRHGGKHIVYLADTAYSRAWPSYIQGADILIHEVGGLSEEEETLAGKGHASARQAAQCALDVKAKRLILVHLPEDPKGDELLLKEAQALFPSTELPRLNIPY